MVELEAREGLEEVEVVKEDAEEAMAVGMVTGEAEEATAMAGVARVMAEAAAAVVVEGVPSGVPATKGFWSFIVHTRR